MAPGSGDAPVKRHGPLGVDPRMTGLEQFQERGIQSPDRFDRHADLDLQPRITKA